MLHKVTAVRADAYDLFHQGTMALSRAERAGIRIDEEYFRHTMDELEVKVKETKATLLKSKLGVSWKKVYGTEMNFGSGDQLQAVLYEYLKIEPINTTANGKPSVDEPTLVQLKNKAPGIDTLLSLRKLEKMGSTYLRGFLMESVNGFIHPNFNLDMVVTYRSSSNAPNFQNIPKRDKMLMKMIRSGLFARQGHLLMEVDYSGLEVSIAACYHKDPKMLEYLHQPTSDMHGDVSKLCFFLDDYTKAQYKPVRDAIKNSFVFPQFYGDYYVNCAKGLCDHLALPKGGKFDGKGWLMPNGDPIGTHLHKKGIKRFDQFLDHVQDMETDFWEKRFRVYAHWKKLHYERYLKTGYVDSFTGFRCWGPMSRNDAINYPVQGAAFHCLLWAFIQVQNIGMQENWDSRLIGQIHDAMIGDIHPDELDHVMGVVNKVCTVDLPNHWDWICVPLRIEAEVTDVDKPWSEMHEYHLN